MSDDNKDKLVACVDLIRRTGASQVQVRYSDDEYPVIWMVVALYDGKSPHKQQGSEVAAALEVTLAAFRLCELLIDGSKCQHCKRDSRFERSLLVRMPMDDKICWYQYDPGTKKYVRGCG